MNKFIFILFCVFGIGCSGPMEVSFPEEFIQNGNDYQLVCEDNHSQPMIFANPEDSKEYFKSLFHSNLEFQDIATSNRFFWFLGYNEEGELTYFVTSLAFHFEPQEINNEDLEVEFEFEIPYLVRAFGNIESTAVCLK